MHENREISSTPWSDDQGRSAKATNPTADTHVPEKSDCAVLPVNQPNKGGQSSAEAGEGRAQMKENIVQSHMHPTQSGKRMSQGLDGVRKVANGNALVWRQLKDDTKAPPDAKNMPPETIEVE